MRARNIKPGFFKNEKIAELPFEARLLFIGLWTIADREGRLEYRPKRIDAEIFPYDKINIEKLIDVIKLHEFIVTFHDNQNEYIQIVNFVKHQKPHPNEAESIIPPCNESLHTITRVTRDITRPTRADVMNVDVMKDDSLKDESRESVQAPNMVRFGEFVFLTDKQHKELFLKLGQTAANEMIERLNGYIGQIGEAKAKAKYKSHYHTILNWWRKDKANGTNDSKSAYSISSPKERTSTYGISPEELRAKVDEERKQELLARIRVDGVGTQNGNENPSVESGDTEPYRKRYPEPRPDVESF